MNDLLKTILKTAEAVAVASVPGAPLVDAAVHGLIDKKGAVDSNILDAAEGAIKAVEAIKGQEIADEVQFRAGCATLEAGFKLIRAALKSPSSTSPQADGAGV